MTRPRITTVRRGKRSISVRAETYAQLVAIAKQRGVTVAALVEELTAKDGRN